MDYGIRNIPFRRARHQPLPVSLRPPYSADWYQSYDPSNANYIQRYFWMSIDKKF
jgi:hypothetical protein